MQGPRPELGEDGKVLEAWPFKFQGRTDNSIHNITIN